MAFGSLQCDCSWIYIYVDGKRGFRAEGRAYYLPTQCNIFYSKQEEAGATQSSIEDKQNKCFGFKCLILPDNELY